MYNQSAEGIEVFLFARREPLPMATPDSLSKNRQNIGSGSLRARNKMNKICGIYEILNLVNGHRYIGSSVDIKKRLRTHKELLRRSIHRSIDLQRAYTKYGDSAFRYDIVLICEPIDLLRYEQELINLYHPAYNTSPTAGSNLGITVSVETRRKQSAARRGENNGMFGRRHSEASRKLMSQTKKGVIPWNKGKRGMQIPSEETRKKQSDAHKGNIPWNTGKTYKRTSGIYYGADNIQSMKVLRYSKNGEFIDEYSGCSEASRITNIDQGSISKCCTGKRLTAGGFVWRYAEGEKDVQ